MQSSISDTSRQVEEIQIALLREAGTARRFALMRRLSATAINLSRRAVARAHPEWNAQEVALEFVALNYGADLAYRLRDYGVIGQDMNSGDLALAIGPVITVWEKLCVPYHLGGSVVSSAYGTPRTTLDIDVVADMQEAQIVPFAHALTGVYYVDAEMISGAIAHRSTFNLIHLTTMIKIDVFLPKSRPYDQEVFRRKRLDTIDDAADAPQFFLTSPEDVILSKLEWFRLGGEVSERQWLDVFGVLRVQRNRLDIAYLQHWAQELAVDDLLRQALQEVA